MYIYLYTSEPDVRARHRDGLRGDERRAVRRGRDPYIYTCVVIYI